jgi:hypothetical protein
MIRRTLALLLAALFLTAPAPATNAQSDARCFPETGYCISGRIRTFWERNGGLPVFGFPLGPQQEEVVEGRGIQVQWFERNRLELHPQNAAPYDVLLGRLGAGRLEQQRRDWRGFPAGGAQPGCRFFPETGHSVCGRILETWRASGLEFDGRAGISEAESLALFGLPLSGLVSERLGDGRTYQVQWFERARFELHPENRRPYDVLLGRLGAEIREQPGAAPQPAQPTAAPAPVPTAPPEAGRPGACLSDEEAELARLINEYRAANGLAAVPVSRSLTTVAQLHARDLQEFRPNSGADARGQACNLHSWSANGPWTPVCYTADHSNAKAMWSKPREITAGVYGGSGYENAFASYGAPVTAAAALGSWQSSAAHNATILQEGTWASYRWPAMGVGISENFAVLWFGDTADPQGTIDACR